MGLCLSPIHSSTPCVVRPKNDGLFGSYPLPPVFCVLGHSIEERGLREMKSRKTLGPTFSILSTSHFFTSDRNWYLLLLVCLLIIYPITTTSFQMVPPQSDSHRSRKNHHHHRRRRNRRGHDTRQSSFASRQQNPRPMTTMILKGEESRNSDHHHHEERSTLRKIEPLYITIGTQCCGKTTFLKERLLSKSELDISLDDQPDVYISVDTSIFLSVFDRTGIDADDNDNLAKQNIDPSSILLHQSYHGKTLFERIRQDNTELKLVVQRLGGSLSSETFATEIIKLFGSSSSTSLAQVLIDGVEEEISVANNDENKNNGRKTTAPEMKSLVPTHIQVFILESLFQPHPSTQESAIQRAHRLLRQSQLHLPVAWGNTNSKPRDYQMALDIASQTRRPVHFLIEGRDFPSLTLSEFIVRNIRRFSQTGKYIPIRAIHDCHDRIEQLVSMKDSERVVATSSRNNMATGSDDRGKEEVTGDSALALDQYLIRLAEPPGSPYRFVLTRDRLVRKEFRNATNSRRNGSTDKRPTPPTQDDGRSRRPQPRQHDQNKRPRWN